MSRIEEPARLHHVAPGVGGQLVWRGVLGLDVNRRNADNVAGWSVTGQQGWWILLNARSPLLAVQLVVHSARRRISFGTFLHYRRSAGRLLWQVVAPQHRRAVPGLLRGARRALTGDG